MRILRALSKYIFLVTVLFNLSCSRVYQGEDREWTAINITQFRDMSQYEQGGHFWCRLRPWGNEQDELNGEKKVRDFVWQHLAEKKRGYIKFSCGYTDTSRTIHYFIEPDKNDVWNVFQRDVFQHSNDEKTITDNLVKVERQDTEFESNNWQLIFKTNSEEVIGTLPMY